jgi:hypothetical protein
MNPPDWTRAFKKHAGKWVAFKSDHQTVVAAGDTLKSARKAAAEKGCNDPIMTRMPKTLRNFIG